MSRKQIPWWDGPVFFLIFFSLLALGAWGVMLIRDAGY